LECGGKRSATPLFFCENVSAREKRRRRFALPAQSKMRLATHNDAIVRVIYSRLNYRQNAGSAGHK